MLNLCASFSHGQTISQHPVVNVKMELLDWWVETQVMRVELKCVKEGAGALCVLVTMGGAHWMQL